MDDMLVMLNERQDEMVTCIGYGTIVFKEMITEQLTVPYSFAPTHLSRQKAGCVASIGIQQYREGKIETAAEHKPDYLRLSQAERELQERSK